MKVVFLDIDGVLNDHTRSDVTNYCTIDKDKVQLFNDLLHKTNAAFVVSSAWRYMVHGGSMTIEGFKYMLASHWVDTKRMIGITEPDEDARGASTGTRGEQIAHWVDSNNRITKYVVIDDLDLGISSLHPFVQTNGSVGLTLDDCVRTMNQLEDQ